MNAFASIFTVFCHPVLKAIMTNLSLFMFAIFVFMSVLFFLHLYFLSQ